MNYEKEAQINEEKKEEEEEEKEEIFDKDNEYSFYKKLEKILKEQAKEKKKKSDDKHKNIKLKNENIANFPLAFFYGKSILAHLFNTECRNCHPITICDTPGLSFDNFIKYIFN